MALGGLESGLLSLKIFMRNGLSKHRFLILSHFEEIFSRSAINMTCVY